VNPTNETGQNLAALTLNGSILDLALRCQAAGSDYKIEQISPISLAYIGDAVYELYVRTRYLLPPKKISRYHQQVVAIVRAEYQAAYLRCLEPYLTDLEKNVVRRGRNAVTSIPRRLSPEIYQQATSLETLIGYLYLTDIERLQELLKLQPLQQ
jgi:ribonuclease-3 family protein